MEKTVVVVQIEFSSAVAISFAHSQYDTISIPRGFRILRGCTCHRDSLVDVSISCLTSTVRSWSGYVHELPEAGIVIETIQPVTLPELLIVKTIYGCDARCWRFAGWPPVAF
jgi:hypothetical protein